MLRWPDRRAVDEAVRAWARRVRDTGPEVTRVGYFGSYARGDWGVGSDIDLVVVVSRSTDPFPRRAIAFDATRLPVPADVFVYTTEEWDAMLTDGGLPRTVADEVVWVA